MADLAALIVEDDADFRGSLVALLERCTNADFDEFLAIREDLLLQIMDCVAASGSGFAFPSQTVYTAKDPGLDEERRRVAIEEVRRWCEAAPSPRA